jgi:hypothetical protein
VLAALAGLAGLALLSGCGSPVTTTAPPPPMVAPLASAVMGSTNGWALVPMGNLAQPENTFWQAFFLPTPSGNWTLRTPPGVADNGGLVIATGDAQVDVVAFRPSQQLKFTPLAVTSNHGATYTSALLPDGIANAPDALATGSTGSAAALTGAGVVASPPGLAKWQPVTSLSTLQTDVGSSCDVQQLTGVAVVAGADVVAGDCDHTTKAGVFIKAADGGYRLAGPMVAPGAQPFAVQVLRVVSYRQGLAVLFTVNPGLHPSYRVAWESTLSGPWSLGPQVASGTLVSTSVTDSGGFAIVTEGSAGALDAAVIDPGSPTWQSLPTLPAGTAVVSVMPGSARTDALVVNGASFRDFRLSSSEWRAAGPTIKVPIDYGSSG